MKPGELWKNTYSLETIFIVGLSENKLHQCIVDYYLLKNPDKIYWLIWNEEYEETDWEKINV